MKKVFPFYAIAILLISLLIMLGSKSIDVHAQDGLSPTPTYDPLKEPFVPDNPTDFELGRNWYWHYCMPCHGDKGQGLTDEWRAVWESDHQDCWGKGCHAGERIEDSFAIPTVVPPVVSSAKLARFSSVHSLYEYLKATHPPQSPGWLEDKQYRAIALYIFSQNDRPLAESTLASTITPEYTSTTPPVAVPALEDPSQQPAIIIYVLLWVFLVVMVIWGIRNRR